MKLKKPHKQSLARRLLAHVVLALSRVCPQVFAGSFKLQVLKLIAAKRLGDSAEVSDTTDTILTALTEQPEKLIRLRHSRTAPIKPVAKIDRQAAANAMTQLQAIGKQAGCELFLLFGGLLGAVREGDIIGSDKDLDFGVFGTDSLERLKSVLDRTYPGAFHLLMANGAPYQLKSKNLFGFNVDIKALTKCDDGTTTWVTAFGKSFLPRKLPYQFDLVQIEFCGVPVLIPEQPERFLEFQYGPDWRIPNPDFHFYINGIATNDDQSEFQLRSGKARMLIYLDRGKFEQASIMATQLSQNHPEDKLLRDFTRVLADACASA